LLHHKFVLADTHKQA